MKTDAFTKGLAIVGTVLLWFPIAATIATSVYAAAVLGMLRVDWLIPAELFAVVVLGGALLLWAAIRAHARRGLVAWGIGVAAGLLIGGQLFAEATGLASGAIEPSGWVGGVVTAAIVIYGFAVVELAVSGALLVRDLFRHADTPAETPPLPTA